MTMRILSAATLSLLTSTTRAFLQHQHQHHQYQCKYRLSTSFSRRLLRRASSSDAGGGESRQQQDVAATTRQNSGKANQHMQKMVAREQRIIVLEELSTVSNKLTPAQQAELNGLRQKSSSFDEQYDPSQFSEEHHAFKAAHNQAFCALAKYCCCQNSNEVGGEESSSLSLSSSLFYLDGPDSQTTRALLAFDDGMSFQAHQLYVANRHEASCIKLRHLLPDANVVCQSATTALQPQPQQEQDHPVCSFGKQKYDSVDHDNVMDTTTTTPNFAAYYFDGCGGHAPQVMDMVAAALQRMTTATTTSRRRQRTAIGFSIVGGNRDVVNKEVQIVQHLVQLARRHRCSNGDGSILQVHHVLDDPTKYGVASNLQKLEGSTLTSWFVLEFSPK